MPPWALYINYTSSTCPGSSFPDNGKISKTSLIGIDPDKNWEVEEIFILSSSPRIYSSKKAHS